MRLTFAQVAVISANVVRLAGDSARLWLFGSRVHDDLRGGDVDLLLELDAPVSEPAQLSARLAAQMSRAWPQGGCPDQSTQFATFADPHHRALRRDSFMKITPAQAARLAFWTRMTDKECQHLLDTDGRLGS